MDQDWEAPQAAAEAPQASQEPVQAWEAPQATSTFEAPQAPSTGSTAPTSWEAPQVLVGQGYSPAAVDYLQKNPATSFSTGAAPIPGVGNAAVGTQGVLPDRSDAAREREEMKNRAMGFFNARIQQMYLDTNGFLKLSPTDRKEVLAAQISQWENEGLPAGQFNAANPDAFKGVGGKNSLSSAMNAYTQDIEKNGIINARQPGAVFDKSGKLVTQQAPTALESGEAAMAQSAPGSSGAMLGGELGALAGSPFAEVGGSVLGGVGGALGGAILGEEGINDLINNYGTEAMRNKYQQIQEAGQMGEEYHPLSSFAGRAIDQALAFNIGMPAEIAENGVRKTLAERFSPRLANAALGAGVEAGSEYGRGDNLSLNKILESGASGAVFTNPRFLPGETPGMNYTGRHWQDTNTPTAESMNAVDGLLRSGSSPADVFSSLGARLPDTPENRRAIRVVSADIRHGRDPSQSLGLINFRPEGLSVNQVVDQVNDHMKDWADAPKVTVHDSYDSPSIPEEMRDRVGKGTLGWKDDEGGIHIVASQHADGDALTGTLYHESMHVGMVRAYQAGLQDKLVSVYDNANPTLKNKLNSVEANLSENDERWATLDAEGRKALVADEALAEASENGVPRGPFDKVSSYIRSFGRTHLGDFGRKLTYSDGEIRQIMNTGYDAVTKGARTDADLGPVRMSRPGFNYTENERQPERNPEQTGLAPSQPTGGFLRNDWHVPGRFPGLPWNEREFPGYVSTGSPASGPFDQYSRRFENTGEGTSYEGAGTYTASPVARPDPYWPGTMKMGPGPVENQYLSEGANFYGSLRGTQFPSRDFGGVKLGEAMTLGQNAYDLSATRGNLLQEDLQKLYQSRFADAREGIKGILDDISRLKAQMDRESIDHTDLDKLDTALSKHPDGIPNTGLPPEETAPYLHKAELNDHARGGLWQQLTVPYVLQHPDILNAARNTEAADKEGYFSSDRILDKIPTDLHNSTLLYAQEHALGRYGRRNGNLEIAAKHDDILQDMDKELSKLPEDIQGNIREYARRTAKETPAELIDRLSPEGSSRLSDQLYENGIQGNVYPGNKTASARGGNYHDHDQYNYVLFKPEEQTQIIDRQRVPPNKDYIRFSQKDGTPEAANDNPIKLEDRFHRAILPDIERNFNTIENPDGGGRRTTLPNPDTAFKEDVRFSRKYSGDFPDTYEGNRDRAKDILRSNFGNFSFNHLNKLGLRPLESYNRMTVEDIQEAAQDLKDQGFNAEIARAQGAIPNDVGYVVALRDLVREKLNSAEEVAGRYRSSGGMRHERELMREVTELGQVLSIFDKTASNLGRMLYALRVSLPFDKSDSTFSDALSRIRFANGTLDKEALDGIARSLISKNPTEIRKSIDKFDPKWKEYGTSLYYNFLLGSTHVQLAKILGHVSQTVLDFGKDILGYGIGKAFNVSGRAHADELINKYAGLLGGLLNKKTYDGGRAWNNAVKQFVAPAGTSVIGNPLAHQVIPNRVLSVALEYGTRGLQATDAFFRTAMEHAAMQQLATIEARKLNGGAKPTSEQISAVMAAPTRAMLSHVRDQANRLLFLEKPIQQATDLTKFVRGFPLGFMVSPIIRTPANIGRAALETFDPTGMGTARNRAALAQGGHAAMRVRAQQMMAAALWIGAATMIGSQTVTGGGPQNQEARAEWLMNHRPYTLQYGRGDNDYIALKDIAPVGTGLATIADMHDAYKYGIQKPNQSGTDTAIQVAGGLAQSVLQNSYLSSTADFFKNGVGSGIKNLIGTAVEASVNVPIRSQYEKEIDPFKRDLSMGEGMDLNLQDKAAAQDNPVVSHYFQGVRPREGLPVARNVFGEPVLADAPMSSDPIAKEVARLADSTGRGALPIIKRSLPNGTKVPNDIYDNFMTIAGPILREAVSEVMKTPEYGKTTNDQQRSYLISRGIAKSGIKGRLDKQLEDMMLRQTPKSEEDLLLPQWKKVLSSIPGE